MTASADIQLVRDFVDQVWNRADPDAADRFLGPDYRDHAYRSGGDAATFKAALAELAAAFPDQRSTVDDAVAVDGTVALRLRLTGTHGGAFRGVAATGKPVDVKVMRFYRVAGGRIAEHWAVLDTLSLLRQIGALPTPAAKT